MRVEVSSLVGMMEVASRLGVQKQTVRAWRQRDYLDFPEPLVVVSRTPLWRWSDVKRWAQSRPTLEDRL